MTRIRTIVLCMHYNTLNKAICTGTDCRIQLNYLKKELAAGRVPQWQPPEPEPAKSLLETVGVPAFTCRYLEDPELAMATSISKSMWTSNPGTPNVTGVAPPAGTVSAIHACAGAALGRGELDAAVHSLMQHCTTASSQQHLQVHLQMVQLHEPAATDSKLVHMLHSSGLCAVTSSSLTALSVTPKFSSTTLTPDAITCMSLQAMCSGMEPA